MLWPPPRGGMKENRLAKTPRSQELGDCPYCGKNRWANVLGENHVKWNDEDAGVWSDSVHRLLECAGCKTTYYQNISHHSEEVDFETGAPITSKVHYPAASKYKSPGWLFALSWSEEDLAELLESLYTAMNHNLTVLAASGVRTVFDVATTKLGIDPALTFEKKVDALKAQGRIGQYEQEDLATMVEAAKAAMHRGWKPSQEQLNTMMQTLERFIHHSFMLKEKSAKLKEKVPPRPKRADRKGA